MAKIKTGCLGATIFLLALIVFAIVFPMVHKTEILNPRDVKTDGKFVALKSGVSLHYRETGAGAPLLLIHGYTSSSYTWKYVTPALAAKHRVLAPDVMGFGLSDKPADAEYNYSSFADQLDEFLTLKGVDRASVGGNSMGGGIALRYALDHPEKVDKLILISSAGVDHGKMHPMFKMMATPGVNSLMSSLNNEFFTRRMLGRMCFHDRSLVTKEKGEAYMLPFRTRGAMNAAARTMSGNDWSSLEPDLGKIKAPTLIIWGDKDKIIPAPIAGKFNSHIPDSRLEILGKCGHMPQEEMPEKTAKLMLAFLDEE